MAVLVTHLLTQLQHVSGLRMTLKSSQKMLGCRLRSGFPFAASAPNASSKASKDL